MAKKKSAQTAKRKPNARSDAVRNNFLEALGDGATVSTAAKEAGINPATAYRWRKDDAEFAADWELAYIQGADALEAEAQRRAVDGVDEPVFFQGHKCGAVRNYSDTMLMFLMKARAPHKFCDRARTAQMIRRWAEDDARKGAGDGATAAREALEVLERLADGKAATAYPIYQL